MAFNLENMTVDYKSMYRMVPSDRLKVAQSGAASDLISSLTPGQLANLFPKYYRDQLPDVGQSGGGSSLGGALSGGTSYRPNQSTSYGPTPSPVLKKQLSPEEKAVQEAITEAGLLGSGAVASGTGELKDGRQQRIKMTYDAFTSAGFSHKQATALTAEVGRENGFQEKFMFGTHSDPYNNATNLGMLSMQGPRLTALKEHLAQEGRFAPDGELMSDQETMNSMARFYMKEMSSTENTKKTQEFLSNPDIDPERAAYLLGTGYIRWRYNDPTYTQHHDYRNQFYSETEKITSQFELAADKIKDLETVISKFEPGMLDKLDKRLQDHYKKASTQQQGMMERVIENIGVDKFNEIMKRQPVNDVTIMSAPGSPIMLPVGGSMAGKSITSGEDVPFSGGAPGSRSFGGPRGTNQLHTGVDIPGTPGDPVIAVDNGTVVGMRKSPSGYGYILDVQYPDNTVHRMAHLGVNGGGEESAYAEGLKVGDTVSAGQQIGIMGYSGNAGAEFPHVHYEVIQRDYYEKTQGSPPGRISGRGDAAEQQLEAGRIDPREWYAKRQEEFLKQQEQAIAAGNSDPVTAAQNNMETATPLPTEQSAVPPPSEQTVEAPPAVIAPGLSIGGTVPMTPGENVVGINTTTGKTEFVSNDRELYTKDDQGNLRVDPSTIRQEDQKAQMASAEPEATQKPQPEQPKQSRPQQPMPASTPDPNFLNTMTSGSMASSPSQLRALNRAKLYNENSSGLVNGHFS
jgi:murein DD-endopeptidase MepM/ murein hydrolase activator NlpD